MLNQLFGAGALASALLLTSLPSLAEGTDSTAGRAQLLKLLRGTYTNEEDVYFAKEAGDPPPPWMSYRVTQNTGAMTLQAVDAYGAEIGDAHAVNIDTGRLSVGDCTAAFAMDAAGVTLSDQSAACADVLPVRIDTDGWTFELPTSAGEPARTTTLRRARAFSCWAAIPKDEKKPDGSTAWHFAPKLRVHDQGGRARTGGGKTGAPEALLRIRNVIWPPPTRNRPSLVLYVFEPEDDQKAVSYSWADPGAERIGINLRWMQASCTLDASS